MLTKLIMTLLSVSLLSFSAYGATLSRGNQGGY